MFPVSPFRFAWLSLPNRSPARHAGAVSDSQSTPHQPSRYQYPYPSPELAAEHPFVPLEFDRLEPAEQRERGRRFLELMQRRRSVRMFSPDPVPAELIDLAIETASTAPSGAHRQPWRFVAVSATELKARIRAAAEEEERINYVDNRMNTEWQEALAPLGTDWHKEFLEIAPWLVVLFEQRYELVADTSAEGVEGEIRRKNYYVKESCGIAAGLFITALHTMGLATLTHTPSPMAFLSKVLDRPANERPFVLFPVGYPLEGTLVPDLARKPLDEVRIRIE